MQRYTFWSLPRKDSADQRDKGQRWLLGYVGGTLIRMTLTLHLKPFSTAKLLGSTRILCALKLCNLESWESRLIVSSVQIICITLRASRVLALRVIQQIIMISSSRLCVQFGYVTYKAPSHVWRTRMGLAPPGWVSAAYGLFSCSSASVQRAQGLWDGAPPGFNALRPIVNYLFHSPAFEALVGAPYKSPFMKPVSHNGVLRIDFIMVPVNPDQELCYEKRNGLNYGNWDPINVPQVGFQVDP